MASMVYHDVRNVAEVTYVSPRQQSSEVRDVRDDPTPSLQMFLKAQPKALGTVQIMVGVVSLLAVGFTYLHRRIQPFDALLSLLPLLIYICSGSVTVAVESKRSHRLVKAALGMNLCSSIAAGLIVGILIFLCRSDRRAYAGITLHFLQFCVSVSIVVFACRACCITAPQEPLVFVSSSVPICPPIISTADSPPPYYPPPYTEK